MSLDPVNIKFLTFEGGGGKGASYLGAIHALEQLKIITHDSAGKLNVDNNGNAIKTNDIPNGGITGISGASAGAITALLIGCGYTSAEIKKIFMETDFNIFFDDPFCIRDKNPSDPFYVNSGSSGTYKDWLKNNMPKINFNQSDFELTPGKEPDWNKWKSIIDDITTNYLIYDHDNPPVYSIEYAENNKKKDAFLNFFYQNLDTYNYEFFCQHRTLVNTAIDVITFVPFFSNPIKNEISHNYDFSYETRKKLTDLFEYYKKSLVWDFGIFSGTQIHQKLDEWITDKYDPDSNNNSAFAIKKRDSLLLNPPIKIKNLWITFKEFYEVFKVDIRFVAVNITTGSKEILSKDSTPELCVATAARMSMGIPGVFKPIIIHPDALSKLKLDDHDPVKKNFVQVDYKDPVTGITSSREINKWSGYWVDGGFFDNAPIGVWGINIEKAILLRLGTRYIYEELNTTHSISSYVKIFLDNIANMGSGQITDTTYPFPENIIQLVISGTSTLKFDYTHVEGSGVNSVRKFDAKLLDTWQYNFNKVAEKFSATQTPNVSPDSDILSSPTIPSP